MCVSHPCHPHSTFLGFIAALAPKVLGASLSLGFGRIILSVRDLRAGRSQALRAKTENEQDGIDQAPPFRLALDTTFC